MSNSEWDGVERRVQDRELWAAIDLYDSRLERLRDQQFLTDEEVSEIHQRCLECRPRRRSVLPAILWALLIAAVLCIMLAIVWHE